MKTTTHHIKVPGKLMIAGEYSVLEPDRRAIVVAVNRYMNAEIKKNERNLLSLPQLGLNDITWDSDGVEVNFSSSDSKLTFIRNAISTFNAFIAEKSIQPHTFSLLITSELDDSSGKKYGLGSSAAVVVTTITSLFKFYGLKPTAELIYKLSAIAHFKTQGNGSCADIAASTYGGWIQYAAFTSTWLLEELRKETPIRKIVEQRWPSLLIENITSPNDLILCVGWTGNVAATAPMVTKINQLRVSRPTEYVNFIERSEKAVSKLIESFAENDVHTAIISLKENREAIQLLSDSAAVNIETPKLKALIQLADKYGSGKTSGAGGGDCGIAFVQNNLDAQHLYHEWNSADILPLHLHVSKFGAL
ncbi:phosphomevalonate kinase [Sporosarcina sp. 6E9]|uniref:phosphomevalonate kinase n=1 Tax=Sporosarcina sp. 6E9 TaxID=2819235 RepID=UPI001B305DDF|nr:phosphomevalonate kinase [Sporosarcina sp. 6E9]